MYCHTRMGKKIYGRTPAFRLNGENQDHHYQRHIEENAESQAHHHQCSIEEFDDRFPMTQSLYNWSQDLEDALWNAGLGDRAILLARIAVCEEALRRFPSEDQLMTENRRRALAESYFEVGETEEAEELFQS